MSPTRLLLALAAGLSAAGSARAQVTTAPFAVPTVPLPGSPAPPLVTFNPAVRPGVTVPNYGFVLPGYGGYYTYPSYFSYGYPGAYLGPGSYGLSPYAYPYLSVNTAFPAYTGPTPYEPPPVNVPNVEPAGTAPARLPSEVSGAEPAKLTIVLPAAGELWVDGVKQKGNGTEFTLNSPALPRGATHRFDVRARWTAGDKRYEDSRAVTVESGERTRLTIVSGDVVKK